MSGGQHIEAVPAKFLRDSVAECLHWFLPDQMQERFLRLGEDMELLDSHGWEPRFQFARPKLAASLALMLQHIREPELGWLMEQWDEDVLFFYVLRFQWLWVRLHTLRDEVWVPAPFEAFWQWGMTLRQDESWVMYTFPAKAAYLKLKKRPLIWRFFAPCDVSMGP